MLWQRKLIVILIGFLVLAIAPVFLEQTANAVGWNNVESWSLNVNRQWNNVESWSLNVTAYGQWRNVELWSVYVQSLAQFHNVESWNMLVSGNAEFHDVETWNLSVYAIGWHTVEVWALSLNCSASWHSVESWNLEVYSQSLISWNDVEAWNMSLNISRSWYDVETWSLNVSLTGSFHDVESWNLTASSGGEWREGETWEFSVRSQSWVQVECWDLNVSTPYWPYTYTFLGMFDEQSGLLIENATVTVYSPFLTPFNVTVNGSATVNLQYKPSYFQLLLPFNYSRYYTPIYSVETIYLFKPTEPYTTYYVGLTDFLGMNNATVESYVSLNGTTFTVERRQFTLNNKIPFVLTQFVQYGFRVRCSQGVYDFGTWITGDPSLLISFTVSPANFPLQSITYGNITISAVRVNKTWIQILYVDVGNATVSVTLQMNIRDSTKPSQLSLAWADTELTNRSYVYNWYDADRYKDYIADVTVVHSVHGTLHWGFPLPDPESTSLGPDFSLFGVLPFASTQLIGFGIVMMVFACFAVKEAALGLVLSIAVAAFLTFINVLSLSWVGISVCLCLAIMWALSRRRAS